MWQHLSDSVPDNYESCMSVAYADSHGNINANCYGNSDCYGYSDGYSNSYGYCDSHSHSNGYTYRNANAYAVRMVHNGLLSAGGHG